MWARLVVVLLVPIGALVLQQETQDSCHDPSSLTAQSFPSMAKKFTMEAKTPDMRWKMKHALAKLTDEDLANCGSCDGIGNAAERQMKFANLATKPVQHKLKKIFYINPHFGTKRMRSISRQLNATAPEYEVERFEAATKKDATRTNVREFTKKGVQEYVNNIGATPLGGKGNPGPTIAVYLSHARVMKHIHTTDPNGEDVYAIFEDDASLPKDWVVRALGLLNTHVPEDWDIFKFGYWSKEGGVKKITPCVDESRGKQFGMQAYFVRPKSIPKILDQLASQQLFDVDGALRGTSKQIKKINEVTSKEEFSTKGLVLYTSAQSIVHHGKFNSMRMQEEEEETALEDDAQVGEDHKDMLKSWPVIEKAWANTVEEERSKMGLLARVVEEESELE